MLPALVVAWILTTAGASSHADLQAPDTATPASAGSMVANRDVVILAGAMSMDVSAAAAFAVDPAAKMAIINSISALIGAPSTSIYVPAIHVVHAGRRLGSVPLHAGRRLGSVFVSPFAWRRLHSDPRVIPAGNVSVNYIISLPGHGPDVGAVLEALQTSSADAIAALIDAEIGELSGRSMKYRVSVLRIDTMVLHDQGEQAGDASSASVLMVSLLAVLGVSVVLVACAISLRRRNKNRARANSCHDDKGKLPVELPVLFDDDESVISLPKETQAETDAAPVMEKVVSWSVDPTMLQVYYSDAVFTPVLLNPDVLERDIEEWLAGKFRCSARDGQGEEEALQDDTSYIVQELGDKTDVEDMDGAIVIEPDVKETLDFA